MEIIFPQISRWKFQKIFEVATTHVFYGYTPENWLTWLETASFNRKYRKKWYPLVKKKPPSLVGGFKPV